LSYGPKIWSTASGSNRDQKSLRGTYSAARNRGRNLTKNSTVSDDFSYHAIFTAPHPNIINQDYLMFALIT